MQKEFLEKLRAEHASVSVYLVSGIKLVGAIKAFDDYALVLTASSSEQLIYKHGIATIVPNVPRQALDGNRK